jgi:hypothetical protein
MLGPPNNGPQRRNAFYVPHGKEEDFHEQLEIPFYRNCQEPGFIIDRSKEPVEQKLAGLCFGARELLKSYFQKGLLLNQEEDHDSCLKSEMLKGKSHVSTRFVDLIFQKNKNEFLNEQLFLHQIAVFLPDDENKEHLFQIAHVNGRKFIIDLTIRQFIDSGLRLRNEETNVFDALLQDGFVELTEKSFKLYLRFFQSRSLFEKNGGYFVNEWALSLNNDLPAISLDQLNQPTCVYVQNSMDDSLFK